MWDTPHNVSEGSQPIANGCKMSDKVTAFFTLIFSLHFFWKRCYISFCGAVFQCHESWTLCWRCHWSKKNWLLHRLTNAKHLGNMLRIMEKTKWKEIMKSGIQLKSKNSQCKNALLETRNTKLPLPGKVFHSTQTWRPSRWTMLRM